MFILGTASTVKPLQFVDINMWDYVVMMVSAVMLFIVLYTFKKNKFDRIEGAVFLFGYIAYVIYLLLR
jgi:cation:H+ antiporter